ncbi:MAG: hypothetical protein AAFO82_03340 [Bacteroidota bacterium]
MKAALSFLISILLTFSLHGQDQRYYRQLGLQLLADQQYEEALAALLSYQKETPNDNKILLGIAICNYHLNEIEESERYFNIYSELVNKTSNRYDLYQARLARVKGEFQNAIQQYKDYLRKEIELVSLRQQAKQELLQCGIALRNAHLFDQLEVKNSGAVINSPQDDIHPIASPNYDDIFYFSSNRRGNMDIYVMEEDSLTAKVLDRSANTGAEEQLLGFGCDGQVMYFSRNEQYILIDSFANTSLDTLGSTIQNSAFFLCDTVLLFASDQLEGFGGYDLFYIRYFDGNWSTPRNLGATINSAYDEQSPFLDKDGRTLYFASNHPRKSIGKFDLFQSIFDLDEELWSIPINLGTTINTYANELDFFINTKGNKAYFSSDRWSGEGGFDIYEINTDAAVSRAYPFLLFDEVQVFKQRKLVQNFKTTQGVYYRIYLKHDTQILDDFPSYLSPIHIELDTTQQVYHHYTRPYQSFETALEWVEEIDIAGSKIVAFLGEEQLTKKQVESLKDKYTNLNFYLDYLNKTD